MNKRNMEINKNKKEILNLELKLPAEIRKFKIITKLKAKTNKNFGKDPKKRSVKELIKYGVVNLDKPSGPTSHQVSAYLQDILNIKKAGHSGTLEI